MDSKPNADELLSCLVSSLSRATEEAVTLQLNALVTTTNDSAQLELVAIAAMMVSNPSVRIAALQILEVHGSVRTVSTLRDVACNADLDTDVRAAAERAHRAVASRIINDGWAASAPPKLLRAS